MTSFQSIFTDLLGAAPPPLKRWMSKPGRVSKLATLMRIALEADAEDDGRKFLAKKYGLTTEESVRLAARPDVVQQVEAWREENGAHPASALVRGLIKTKLEAEPVARVPATAPVIPYRKGMSDYEIRKHLMEGSWVTMKQAGVTKWSRLLHPTDIGGGFTRNAGEGFWHFTASKPNWLHRLTGPKFETPPAPKRITSTTTKPDGKVVVEFRLKKLNYRLVGEATDRYPLVFSGGVIAGLSRRALGSLTQDEERKVVDEWRKATGMEPSEGTLAAIEAAPVEQVPEADRPAVWAKAGAQFAEVLQTFGYGQKNVRAVYGGGWEKQAVTEISVKGLKVKIATRSKGTAAPDYYQRIGGAEDYPSGTLYVSNGIMVVPAPDGAAAQKLINRGNWQVQREIRDFVAHADVSKEATILSLPDPGVWKQIYDEGGVTTKTVQRAYLSSGGEVDPLILFAAIAAAGDGARIYHSGGLNPVTVKGQDGTAVLMPMRMD